MAFPRMAIRGLGGGEKSEKSVKGVKGGKG
jgi:hypothetical protein